jgi:hypothetical protein
MRDDATRECMIPPPQGKFCNSLRTSPVRRDAIRSIVDQEHRPALSEEDHDPIRPTETDGGRR